MPPPVNPYAAKSNTKRAAVEMPNLGPRVAKSNAKPSTAVEVPSPAAATQDRKPALVSPKAGHAPTAFVEGIPVASTTTKTYPTDNSHSSLNLPRSTPNRPMVRRDVSVTVVPTPYGQVRIIKHSATYVQMCPPSSS